MNLLRNIFDFTFLRIKTIELFVESIKNTLVENFTNEEDDVFEEIITVIIIIFFPRLIIYLDIQRISSPSLIILGLKEALKWGVLQ